jgi:UDP-3-O-[3-hydroxymyristoyl] glucosamine N-acyltransferase
MGVSLGQLAVRYGCELKGDPDKVVDRVATLARADDRCVGFLANSAYRGQLAGTRAAAVILAPPDAAGCPVGALVTRDPYVVYARIAAELHPAPDAEPGIHPTAVIGPGGAIPASCEIGPGVVLGRGVVLGERVVLGARTILGDGVSVGADTRLMPGVTVYPGVRIGGRCVLHTGVVLGSDGFGFAREREGSYVKVPQLGSVAVGDDVEIGANTTVDRGAIDDTVIGNGVKLDNQIQVGHNVRIGEHTVIAAQTGISGSTTLGARCTIGGQAGFAGHIVVVDDVVIGGGTSVTGSIRTAGVYAGGGTPADQLSRWRRNMARFGQLDELAKRVRSLEKRLSDLMTPGSTPPGSQKS